ncbi:MAG: ATP-binding cassette domain-containing protein [Rhodospirillaceae bacterium]
MSLINLDCITKIFGPQEKEALALIREGVSIPEIRIKCEAVPALAQISLAIEPGEVFVIMGLSGSGKSTLLRVINRLVEPTSGSVFIDGVDIGPLSATDLRVLRQQRLSMVFQGFGLLPHRNVHDNIKFGLEIQGQIQGEQIEEIDAWISRVGLEGFAHAFPHELSGGMQQRVGLARALATGADILLMDEPFSALDPLIRREMQSLLADLEQELCRTIVFVTHDLAEAVKLGSRIAILRDGQIVQMGTGEEILTNPADSYVRAFTKDLTS